jgi:hypothetical protein
MGRGLLCRYNTGSAFHVKLASHTRKLAAEFPKASNHGDGRSTQVII